MNKYLMKIKNILLIYLILILFSCKWSGEKHAIYTITKSITADSAAVVSAHPLATAIGLDILRAGGNAADAAIAVQFALAVCYPGAGNIGGGGFMVYRSHDGQISALDFREKAPTAVCLDP